MATIRERKPGVWEVRAFAGRDTSGRPVQTSRTVRGTKRDALRLAAAFDSRPATHAAGRTVADILKAWVEVNQEVWAESSRRDQESRVAKVLADLIASVPVARFGVADVERWHARMRRAQDRRDRPSAAGTRCCGRRPAQAVRWEWIGTNPAAAARLRQPSGAARGHGHRGSQGGHRGRPGDGRCGRCGGAPRRGRRPPAGGVGRLAVGGVDGDRFTVDKAVELAPTRGAAARSFAWRRRRRPTGGE